MILHLQPNAPPSTLILTLSLGALLVFSFSACAKRSHATNADQAATARSSRRININTATAKELEALPGVGAILADRIIEHRKTYGPFRRVEHLMMVRGISDARFRAMRHLITVE